MSFRWPRKLFESLARRRPLVVELDDIQWAEPQDDIESERAPEERPPHVNRNAAR